MSSIIGYASVSTREQNPQAHEAELRAATRVFIDHGESSRTGSRPYSAACLDYLRDGDTSIPMGKP